VIGKYKIKYAGDIAALEKIIKATVDTGILVFTWERFKSWEEARKVYCNLDFEDRYWFIIGFHPDCCRICSMAPTYWHRIGELQEITLEDFLKTVNA